MKASKWQPNWTKLNINFIILTFHSCFMLKGFKSSLQHIYSHYETKECMEFIFLMYLHWLTANMYNAHASHTKPLWMCSFLFQKKLQFYSRVYYNFSDDGKNESWFSSCWSSSHESRNNFLLITVKIAVADWLLLLLCFKSHYYMALLRWSWLGNLKNSNIHMLFRSCWHPIIPFKVSLTQNRFSLLGSFPSKRSKNYW